ncbi:uncharacterized protein LOC114391614 [Glycine soja]|uniref:uncharacterized protein LOC114391614 n=1 Tax=Glycine soja TaxID=3848 RepID=UPI00103E8C4B|nr:uncharacterized protein LOC114391614 [Glycine soja]
MDEDQWMYDSMVSEEVNMNVESEVDVGVKVEHVDCSDAFNTSQLFASRDEVLQWARSLAHDIGRASFLLIACERSWKYSPKKDNLVRTCTGMTFFAAFAYLEGECLNNVVWSLQQFRGLFMRVDALPRVTVTDRVESAHWSLKRLLQKSVGDICSVWEAMNNMMTLQHTQIKASFETSMHVVGHVFKVTLYKKLLGMVSRYTLNEIAAEYERVAYAGKNPSRCGCVMRSTHGLPCACELFKYVVTITEEMETISKRFEQLDVCGKVHLKSKLREIAYHDMNSMCPPPKKMKTKGAPKKPLTKQQKLTKRDTSYWEYVDALHFVQNSNSDGNCDYRAIVALLGMGEESWSLVRNHLHKELISWSEEYINLVGGIERFEELKHSLLVDGLSMVTMDKWMNITDMGYVIASQYNVIIISLSR